MAEEANRVTRRVAVVGGGITGLAAAYRLQERGVEYALFEASPRLGGKIVTERAEGFVVEGGPDSFLRDKPWALDLALRLGLEAELAGTQAGQKTFLVREGRLVAVPEGMGFVIPTRFWPFITSPLLSWRGKLRVGLEFAIPPRKGAGDESVADFIRRRLGQEMLERAAEPLMGGIHVSDPERQSLLGAFPRFHKMEQEHGSLIRAARAQRQYAARINGNGAEAAWKRSGFVTLEGGMERLVEAVAGQLERGRVFTGCAVTGVALRPGGGYFMAAGGEALEFDAVILAAPAAVAAELTAPFAPELGKALGAIRSVSTATVMLAYRAQDAGRLEGSGYLAPRSEGRPVSACTISSNKFAGRAPEGMVLARCFLGGPGQEEMVFKEDEELVRIARGELAALMGIRAEPVLARVFRWVRANPQYEVGHLERVAEIRRLCAARPGLAVAGCAYEGVGIPDCVRQGQEAAELVYAGYPSLPYTNDGESRRNGS
jgi:oxygen-dependent protoporphyrinogen oxidase